MSNIKPRQLTQEQAIDICDNFEFYSTVISVTDEPQVIQIDTDEFGLIEMSEEDFHKYYSKIK